MVANCPHCGRLLNVTAEPGSQVTCPQCHNPITAPEGSGASVYRPVAVSVMGWIGLLFGLGNVLCSPFSAARSAVSGLPPEQAVGLAGMYALLSLVQIVGSAGLLRLRSWAPLVLGMWAVVDLLAAWIGIAAGSSRAMARGGIDPAAVQAGIGLAVVITMIVPVATLIVVTRQDVTTACQD